jgi:hypothetical protein
MRSLILASATALTAAQLVSATPANAADPTTADCLAAADRSADLRPAHKLRETRDKLLICSAATCPNDVRDECVRRLTEVNAAMPTIVFETKDSAGNDVAAVKVTMDGQLLATRLEGVALSIDPGEHSFVFDAAGQPPVQKSLVIREGEKDRRERIVLSPAMGSRANEAETEKPRHSGLLGWSLVGGGLALGVAGGVLMASESSSASSAATSRDRSSYNNAQTLWTAGLVGSIAGAAAVVGGGILLLTVSPEKRVSASRTSIWISFTGDRLNVGGEW